MAINQLDEKEAREMREREERERQRGRVETKKDKISRDKFVILCPSCTEYIGNNVSFHINIFNYNYYV